MKRSIIVAIGFCIMSALLVCIYGCGGGESATQSSAGNTTQETGTIRGRVVLENRQAANDLIATIQDADISAPVNADGSFELTGVPTGEQVVSIIGQTQNLGAHLTVMVRPNATTDIGEVRPRPTGMISGIVSTVNEDGQKQPVARARVRARPISSNTETLADLPNGRFHLTARTNPQGEYVLRAVPPGTYLVTVEHPDYEPAAKTVEVEALKGVTANFELTPRETTAGIVRGRVMARFSDEEALLPLADALVILVPRMAQIPEIPRPILAPMEASVQEFVESLEPPPPPQMGAGELPSEVGKGQAHMPSELPRWRPLLTFTRADGSYEITGVPSGKYLAIAIKRGYSEEQQEISIEGNETVELNFVLEAQFGTVVGQVKDATAEKPIKGAMVIAIPEDDPFWEPPPMPWIEGQGHGAREGGVNVATQVAKPLMRHGAVTDDDGTYKLVLRAGSYHLIAFARGYQRAVESVEVTAGSKRRVDFALEPMQMPEGEHPQVQLKLVLDKRFYEVGQSVKMTLTVSNISDQEVTLQFMNAQQYDFIIYGDEGREHKVWQWSHGLTFTQALQELTLPPGKSQTFTCEWNQRDLNGAQVPTGRYWAVGVITTKPRMHSKPVWFVIGNVEPEELEQMMQGETHGHNG